MKILLAAVHSRGEVGTGAGEALFNALHPAASLPHYGEGESGAARREARPTMRSDGEKLGAGGDDPPGEPMDLRVCQKI
jgi:hypothetical protein